MSCMNLIFLGKSCWVGAAVLHYQFIAIAGLLRLKDHRHNSLTVAHLTLQYSQQQCEGHDQSLPSSQLLSCDHTS